MMKRACNLFEQREHGRGRVADRRQHIGFVASADPRGLGRNGVALIDIGKQRAFGEKLATTPGVNRNPVTGGEMPDHAEPAACNQEYRSGRFALPEQRFVAGELAHWPQPEQSLQGLVVEIAHYPLGKPSLMLCASLRPCT